MMRICIRLTKKPARRAGKSMCAARLRLLKTAFILTAKPSITTRCRVFIPIFCRLFAAADGKLLWGKKCLRRSARIWRPEYIFTGKIGKVFARKTGKSAFYDNLPEISKLWLTEAGDDPVLLARDPYAERSKLKIIAIDRQNQNINFVAARFFRTRSEADF